MTIKLTVMVADDQPDTAGLPLELLSDGKVMGQAIVDNDGIAEFDVDPTSLVQASVRIPADDALRVITGTQIEK